MSQYSGLSLKEIYIQRCHSLDCKVNSELCHKLSDTPDDFNSMTVLDVTRNFLGPQGVIALLDVIECCTSLRTVILQQQHLNTTAIEKMCFVLRRHKSVTCIDLSNNPLNISCGTLLLQLAKDNRNIENIILHNTLVRQAMMTMIVSQLVQNRDQKLAFGLMQEYNNGTGLPAAGSGVSAVASLRTNSISTGAADVDPEVSLRRRTRVAHRAPPFEIKALLDRIPNTVCDVLFDADPIPPLSSLCSTFNYWFNDIQFAHNDTASHFIATREFGIARWRRIQELYPDTTLFPISDDQNGDQAKPVDFMDRVSSPYHWILTTVSACIDTLADLKAVFVLPPPECVNTGLYGAKFFIDGEWRFIFVDDFVPVDANDELIFAKLGGGQKFFWPCILEKMLAKLYGGYHMLEPAHVSDAVTESILRRPTFARTMADLTGGLHVTSVVQSNDAEEAERCWETMVDVLWSTSNGGARVATQMVAFSKSTTLNGIDPDTAYSVLQARQLHGFRLVQLMCPWSLSHWKGDWSDESPLWAANPDVRQVLYGLNMRLHNSIVAANSSGVEGSSPLRAGGQMVLPSRSNRKGQFWISYSLFLKSFGEIHICRNLHSLPERRILGEWGTKTAGGPVSSPSWYTNPRLRLCVKERGPLVVNISLPDRRFARDAVEQTLGFHIIEDDMFPLGFPIDESKYTKRPPPERHMLRAAGGCLYRSGYARTDTVTLERVFEKSDNYWIIPSTYTAGQLAKFVVRVFSYRPFSITQEQLEDHWFSRSVEDVVASSGELRYGEDNSQVALCISDEAVSKHTTTLRPTLSSLMTLRQGLSAQSHYVRVVVSAEIKRCVLPENKEDASASRSRQGSGAVGGGGGSARRRRVTFDVKESKAAAAAPSALEQVSMALYIAKGEVRADPEELPGRTIGLIEDDNIIGSSLFVQNRFVFAECEASLGEMCNIVCAVQPPHTRAVVQYTVWCTASLNPLKVLPPWPKQRVVVEWAEENGSGSYHSADGHPQVEVFPVRPLDRFVFRMRVFDFSCTQPAVSLSVLHNNGRRGEKWVGNITLDKIVTRSVYVRENWVQCELVVDDDDDTDSIIIVPCLQPAGSMGSCELEVSSELGQFETRILVGAKPDAPEE